MIIILSGFLFTYVGLQLFGKLYICLLFFLSLHATFNDKNVFKHFNEGNVIK